MISLLLDHYTIKTSRRALIFSSMVTLMLPGISISGEGLNVFELIFEVEKHQLLNTMQIISLYFLWVYIWLNFGKLLETSLQFISNYYSEQSQKSQQEAKRIDDEYHEEMKHGPQPEHEPEPWYEESYRKQAHARKMTNFASFSIKPMIIIAVIAIEYSPPIILGLCATIIPVQVNEWIFSIVGA